MRPTSRSTTTNLPSAWIATALAMSVLRLRSVVTLPPVPHGGPRSPPAAWAAGTRRAGPDVPVADGLPWLPVAESRRGLSVDQEIAAESMVRRIVHVTD